MIRLAFILVAAISILAGCSKPSDTTVAVPRPHAFPRVDIPSAQYRTVDPDTSGLRRLVVNADTRVSIDTAHRAVEGRWLNVAYNSMPGVVVYITVSRVDSPDEMNQLVDNRVERMALNSGGNSSELTELTSEGGFTARVLSTPRGTVTPVQFLATSPQSGVAVSGAVYIDALNTPGAADSLAPAIDALKRDVIHSMTRLQ